jgi:hypothetical protein
MAWPAPAFRPPTVTTASYRVLVSAGLVDEMSGGRYRVHGLDAERNRRRDSATRLRTGRDPVGTQAGPSWEAVGKQPVRTHRAEGRDETRRDEGETNARATDERFDAPEQEALTWLAKHGCDVRPGNGYHQRLVVAVEHHGVNALIGMMDRLAAAGTKAGDTKGFLFGAIDTLDARSRPKLAELEAEDRAGNSSAARQRRIDRTRAETAAMRSAIEGNDVA